MKILLLIITIAVLALGPSAGVGYAATYRFTDAQNNKAWNDPANWKTGTSCSDITGAGAVPSATDDAVICEDKIAQITNTSAVARTVTVEGGTAAIEIKPDSSSSAKLTLGTSGGALTSTLAGGERIRLLDAVGSVTNFATLAIESADHTFLASGSAWTIRGSDDLAEITIADGKSLTTDDGFVRGNLKIRSPNDGTGKLVANNAYFEASTTNGTLLIAPYALDGLTDEGLSPSWDAFDGGTLEFGAAIQTVLGASMATEFVMAQSATDPFVPSRIVVNASTPLVGHGGLFIQDGGKLIVNQNLTLGSESVTCSITDGSIEVAANKLFIHY